MGVKIQLTDRLRLSLAVLVAKTITFLVRLLHLGAASVLPGEIASRLQPQLLPLLCRQVKHSVVLIVGTNGKTTTSLLLGELLKGQGWRVAHNATGANLENGLMTALLENTNLLGQLTVDYAILEVDENVLPKVLPLIQPHLILCLNLFRDQLDRYGEVDTISQRWEKEIATLPPETIVILNADDPTLSYLGQQLCQRVLFFGLNEPDQYLEEIPHAVDSLYCPRCGYLLVYQGVYLSHLGDFHCPNCGFTKGQLVLDSREWPQILIGLYNKYNTLAAVLAAQQLGVEEVAIRDKIAHFRAAFGRAEELEINGKRVRILLSKNPVGMNETIRAINQANGQTTLLVLNDRTPDGTDVSWIWDVDTERLVERGGTLIVSGDRVYDLALRLHYSQSQDDGRGDPLNGGKGDPPGRPYRLIVREDLRTAIATALECTPEGETLYILPTYSAMLEVRQVLTGRKIL